MMGLHPPALAAVAAAVIVAVVSYVVFARRYREVALKRRFPALDTRSPRPVSLMSDPLLIVESAPDAKPYELALRTLVAEHVELLREEEQLAQSQGIMDRVERKASDSAKRVDQLQTARLFRWLRLAIASKRQWVVGKFRDKALTMLKRSQTRYSEAIAKLTRVESEVATRRTEWKRFREAGEQLSAPTMERDTLLVMFRGWAGPKSIARLLRRHRLTVLSGIARLPLFVVQLPASGAPATAEGAAARLRAAVEVLNGEKIVRVAVQNATLGAATIPLPNLPPQEIPAAANRALAISRFPEAHARNRTRHVDGRVDVGVIDVGFLPNDEELIITPLPGQQNQEDPHGTNVAAIIAATPRNGVAIDGAAAPFARIIGAAPQGAIFDEFAALLDRMLQRRPRVRVINASVSYNWRSKGVVPETSPSTQDLVARQGVIVRTLMRAASSTVLVTAAGNDCNNVQNCQSPATWASPYNWAALAPKSAEAGKPSSNIIVVEGLDASGTDRLPMSNVGGHIRAIGDDVFTVAANMALTREDGTSVAAPLVTSAVALMLLVNPRVSVADIRKNLGIGNGLGNDAPKLDAFEAVRLSEP